MVFRMIDPGMSRRLALIFASVLVLGAAALIFFRILPPRGGRAAPAETTFRNVTDKDLHYSVPNAGPEYGPELRTLKPGAVDRFRASARFEVYYDSQDKTWLFIASPGKPYSFRLNENGLVRIYAGSHGREDAADLAPYLGTPNAVVRKMLEMADLRPSDVLYDLGCGDGRIVIAAARDFGVHAVGIDIVPKMIEESKANARLDGVEKLTRFICMDAVKADLSKATVVTLYLLPESYKLVRPKLEKELPAGARVVAHFYPITGWENRLTGRATVVDEDGVEHGIFLYRKAP